MDLVDHVDQSFRLSEWTFTGKVKNSRNKLEDNNLLVKKYGSKVARKIHMRLAELSAAENCSTIPPNAHFHRINLGKDSNCFAVDLPSQGGEKREVKINIESIWKFQYFKIRNHNVY
jgi:hypothetical protein